jgi:cardiolipin synthase (CMP-forming)
MTSPRWWNAANLLTICRLLLAPLVVREIVMLHAREAFFLLIVASLTDMFDGFLARATNTVSELGELIDPVADKVLLSGVFLGLAWIRTVPVWFVALVFGRDLLILLASAYVKLFTSYSNLRPTLYGKISTVLQILTGALFVAANATKSESFRDAGRISLWPAAVLTAWSGIHYGWRGIRYFSRR